MCYNTSNFELLIRKQSEATRILVDRMIKNFIRGVMYGRGVGYNNRQLTFHKNIGRDDKAGDGTHVWTYKWLIKEKKYNISTSESLQIVINKRRRVDETEWGAT